MNRRLNITILSACVAMILALVVCLAVTFTRALADDVDYMALMIQAVEECDPETGHWAEAQRNEKIRSLGLDYPMIAWDELDLLARIVWQEAGSDGISYEWRRDVAQVVINRAASPEFPDTIAEVIYQRGQYSGASRLWAAQPTRECAEAALAALEGEGDLPASVVFQANFTQGSGVYRSYYLRPYGWTYFCVSGRPGLY